MTTNFALSLSSDGIQLLQRADDGWLLVGNTPLDAPDLAAALADLHEDATRLAPDGIRTKLLIPNEQIKYITLESGQTSLADVQAALTGATPYAVNDLVIDFNRDRGRTFIAAVPRETLAEAEAFATKYDFAPQCFAAVPEPDTFQTEVFFGPTKAATGPVARDATPVAVVGHAASAAPVVDASDEVPIFESLPRMADPESVASIVPEKPADPVLAVPTGQVDGPQITTPDTSIPPPPAKPVAAATPDPVAAPTVTGDTNTVLAVPRAEDIAATGGFAWHREAPVVQANPQDKPVEDDAKSAFASRQAQTKRGKPRYLGLILTAILLIVMALVAAWASTLSEEDLAKWFGYAGGGVVETADVTAPPAETQVTAAPSQADDATVAAAPSELTDDAALPQLRATALGRVLSPAEADRIYAATGVWQRAPRLPLEPRSETLSLPLPQTESALATAARPVMPDITTMSPDLALIAPSDPPAAGTDFQRDADGFILATPQGTLTPQGAMVFSGPASKRPQLRPQSAAADATANLLTAPAGVVLIAGRPSKVPPLRPENAAQPATDETATAAGARPEVRPEGLGADADQAPDQLAFADPALADARPKLRPADLAPASATESDAEPEPAPPAVPDITDVVAAIAAAAPASPFVTPTARAVRASPRPDPRPRNFARVVSRATDLAARQQAANQQAANQQAAAQQQATTRQATAAPAAAVSDAPARASGPVPGGVANAATLQNAIKLRDVNLIGVYGRPNERRALVRLGNGRYVKVQVGSSLEGGQVTAIGDSALNYVKRGRTYAIQLPNG